MFTLKCNIHLMLSMRIKLIRVQRDVDTQSDRHRTGTLNEHGK